MPHEELGERAARAVARLRPAVLRGVALACEFIVPSLPDSPVVAALQAACLARQRRAGGRRK